MTTPERQTVDELLAQCQRAVAASYRAMEQAQLSCARAEELRLRASHGKIAAQQHAETLRAWKQAE